MGWKRRNILKDTGFYKTSCQLLTFAVDVFGRGFLPLAHLSSQRGSQMKVFISASSTQGPQRDKTATQQSDAAEATPLNKGHCCYSAFIHHKACIPSQPNGPKEISSCVYSRLGGRHQQSVKRALLSSAIWLFGRHNLFHPSHRVPSVSVFLVIDRHPLQRILSIVLSPVALICQQRAY